MPSSSRPPLHPLPFPTRRSSDLLRPQAPAARRRRQRLSGAVGLQRHRHRASQYGRWSRPAADQPAHQLLLPLGAAGNQRRGAERLRSEEHTSELQSLTNLVCPLHPDLLFILSLSLHDALPIFYGHKPQLHAVVDNGFREPSGSNGIAIAPANTVDGHALLLINPHTSFFFRSELQVTSDEGLNA